MTSDRSRGGSATVTGGKLQCRVTSGGPSDASNGRPALALHGDVHGHWPLVGRGAECALLSDAIGAGNWAGAMVAGEAGVGKTRLAFEALREAERRGCSTIWVVATQSAASIPFGPFAHLLPDLPKAAVSRLDLLCQLAETLVGRARGSRLVVGVDDTHLLDHASAALVHQLALTHRAFVLATLRTGEPAPDSIVALWKDGLAKRLQLGPLTEDEVYALVPVVLGGHVTQSTIARLWSVTGGNTLFLRELILAGVEAGTLRESGGIWSWLGPMTVNHRLQEVVNSRLGTLEPDLVALMEVLAYGEPVSPHLLENLSFSLAVLEAAERRGVVTVKEDGRRTFVRLAHPLYAEVVRARCPKLRARAVHRELAAALKATGAHRGEDVLRLATFGLESGDPGSPDVLLAGARRAMVVDLELSERLARSAVAAGGGVAGTLALAKALVEQGRGPEAVELLRPLELREGHPGDQVSAAVLLADGVWQELGHPDQAEQILIRAEHDITDPALRDELMALRAAILCFAGRPQDAVKTASGILERMGATEQACVWAVLASILGCAVAGQLERAATTANTWIRVVTRLEDVIQLEVGQAYALCLSGSLDEATAILSEVYQQAVARGAGELAALCALEIGFIELSRGRALRALTWLREAATVFRQPSQINYLSVCFATLARASLVTGDLKEAEAILREAEASHTAAVAVFEPHLRLARAWLAAHYGEMSRARALALATAEVAEARGQYADAVIAVHDLARFGDPRPSWSAHLASLVDGPLAPICAAHAAALAARDGQRLDEAAAAFAALGFNLFAAEASAGAAAVYRAQGRNASMLASGARSQRWLENCEGAQSPVLSALATPLLTRREREVATLASRGMQSAQIADRLVLSTRTVETYLQRAYAKLGVNSRGELKALLPSAL